MKLHTLSIVGIVIALALITSACGQKKQAAPLASNDQHESVEAPAANSVPEKQASTRDAVVRHMHMHARQLGRLTAALENDDLEATQTPAYWLSRHEGMKVFPEEWAPHMKAMRAAAMEVQWSTDLETARAASGRIAESCNGCHNGAGFDIDITRTEVY